MFLKISQISQKHTCTECSFLIKLQASGLQLYQKRDSVRVAFLWTLWNFQEQLFYRTPPVDASLLRRKAVVLTWLTFSFDTNLNFLQVRVCTKTKKAKWTHAVTDKVNWNRWKQVCRKKKRLHENLSPFTNFMQIGLLEFKNLRRLTL